MYIIEQVACGQVSAGGIKTEIVLGVGELVTGVFLLGISLGAPESQEGAAIVTFLAGGLVGFAGSLRLSELATA